MIVASINYRLGVFAWLAHPDLSKESEKMFQNYGTLDQIAALKWVEDNIVNFVNLIMQPFLANRLEDKL